MLQALWGLQDPDTAWEGPCPAQIRHIPLQCRLEFWEPLRLWEWAGWLLASSLLTPGELRSLEQVIRYLQRNHPWCLSSCQTLGQ